jgi:putative transposase
MQQVKKSCRQGDEAIGKSKGGKSTKVHASVDALGNPRRLILTAGQAHDVHTGPALVEGEDTEAVIADKAYDSDEFLALIAQMGAEAVVPPKANRVEQREYDKNLYADRNKVERFYNKAKHYRRLATRYEKTARNYLAFWHVASCIILTL